MTTPGQTLRGSCLCGGVDFRAPLLATDGTHCYCTMCQKFHGAATSSCIDVAASGYVVERGVELIVEYASSERGRCGFCSTCGSMLYWRGVETPERVAVTPGMLQPPYTRAATPEMFVEHKPAWLPHL